MGSPAASASLLRIYYLATPAFAVSDWLGANVRAVGLAAYPDWRVAYYVACTLAGLLISLRPRWSDAVGLAEASANVLLLVLAVVVPYVDAISAAAAGQTPARLPFTGWFLVNFLISGAVWVLVFQQRLAAWSGTTLPPTRPTD